MENKYYICEKCGDVTTEQELYHAISECGANGMCYCRFTEEVWKEDDSGYNCICDRIFMPYTQITKNQYDWLKAQSNEAIRLRMFRTIDRELLL